MERKETDVYLRLDPARLPQHIAIIMDGNGAAGPGAGTCRASPDTALARRRAFHGRNCGAHWNSGADALRLLRRKLEKTSEDGSRFPDASFVPLSPSEIKTLNENNIRLKYIGRQHELPESVQREMEEASDAYIKEYRDAAERWP